jgi:hypothetical protein
MAHPSCQSVFLFRVHLLGSNLARYDPGAFRLGGIKGKEDI